MLIGLLMVSHEDDVLPETLSRHETLVDAFYAIDGTRPPSPLIATSPKCTGVVLDKQLRGQFGRRTPCDGWRDRILEDAYRDFGHDHWFLLLHADEIWRFDPADAIAANPEADGFVFRLPLRYAPSPWDDSRSPIEQMTSRLRPGYPEFRMFRGGAHVRYNPRQHFDVRPRGLEHVVWSVGFEIDHYPFRSPESQLLRAAMTFDPDNYVGAPLDAAAIEGRFLGAAEYSILE